MAVVRPLASTRSVCCPQRRLRPVTEVARHDGEHVVAYAALLSKARTTVRCATTNVTSQMQGEKVARVWAPNAAHKQRKVAVHTDDDATRCA
jgi:hypothetical protein